MTHAEGRCERDSWFALSVSTRAIIAWGLQRIHARSEACNRCPVTEFPRSHGLRGNAAFAAPRREPSAHPVKLQLCRNLCPQSGEGAFPRSAWERGQTQRVGTRAKVAFRSAKGWPRRWRDGYAHFREPPFLSRSERRLWRRFVQKLGAKGRLCSSDSPADCFDHPAPNRNTLAAVPPKTLARSSADKWVRKPATRSRSAR